MTLCDAHGEVEVPFGQLFIYRNATLEVVCPDSEATAQEGRLILCVRLVAGILEGSHGQLFGLQDGKPAPLFVFTSELVAGCVRDYIEAARPEQPAQSKPEQSRGRKRDQRHEQLEPITGNLF